MTSTRATDHRARRHEHRRRLILRTAADLFGEHGYDGTTLESIAATLGLSKASLYYYVDSKEALLTELCAEISRQIVERAHARTPADATPEARLRTFLTAHFMVIHEHPAGRVLGENLDAVFGSSATPAMQDARHAHERALAQILSDGVEAGIFRTVDAGVTARFVLAALNTSTRWYQSTGPRGPADMARDVVDLVLYGVADG